jgi:hypothetical protein
VQALCFLKELAEAERLREIRPLTGTYPRQRQK